MQKNKLLKNYIYNSSYQILLIIIPLFTTPYLTRTLGSTSLGIDSYILSVVTLFYTFGSLGLNAYSQREIAYKRNSPVELSNTFFSLLSIRIFLCIIVLIIYSIFSMFTPYKTLFLIQSITLLSNFLDISWFFIGMEEMKIVAIRNSLIKILLTICIFVFIKDSNDLTLYIWLFALSNIISTACIYTQIQKYISFSLQIKLNFKSHIKPIILLFLPQASSILYVQFDKTMLGLLASDVSFVSIYDKAEVIVKAPLAFISALTAVILPRIANDFANENLDSIHITINTVLEYITMIILPMVAGIIMISNVLVPWYLGTGYMASINVVKILAPIILAIGLSNVSGAQYLVATNQTKYLTKSYLSAAIFNIIGNYFLIPKYNAIGAAITTLGAEYIVTIIQFYYMKKTFTKFTFVKQLPKRIFACFSMIVILYILKKSLPLSVFSLFPLIITGILVYFAVLILLKDQLIITLIKQLKHYFVRYR